MLQCMDFVNPPQHREDFVEMPQIDLRRGITLTCSFLKIGDRSPSVPRSPPAEA